MMGLMGARLSAVGGRRAAAAQQVSGHLDALSSPQGLGLGGGLVGASPAPGRFTAPALVALLHTGAPGVQVADAAPAQ